VAVVHERLTTFQQSWRPTVATPTDVRTLSDDQAEHKVQND
jgi:hypothetical protein